MKVRDFIEVASENKKTVIYDCIGKRLSEYDGKNSIDEKYLDEEILNISFYEDFFVVLLKRFSENMEG